MSATNFNTRNDTFRKLMGNGLTYAVPRFQRDYSWSETEWEDLWQDILGVLGEGGEPAHYMGYLVLQTSDDRRFDVIDGQQRLTTLSLVVLAALRNLKRLSADEGQDGPTRLRLEGLRQAYIGYLDPVTLVPRSKLTLNRNNNTYFQTYLVPLADTLPQRGFKASEHSLRKAFEYFDRQFREQVKGHADPGRAIAELIDSMSDRLFFTVITVTDELNAYKVFETLNARGVRLSATDLLKNYLFSVLARDGQHEHELQALDDRWEQIVGRLGAESFPDFLRVHWISRGNFVRQSDLFKAIRGKISGRGAVFNLLVGMEQDMDTFLALSSPETSAWPPRLKGYARQLRMFGVRQPFPLVLAARRLLGDADFEALLRALVAMSFRYNVIGNLQANEQERAYVAEAERLSKAETRSLAEVLEGLRSIYVNDESFRAAFAEKVIGTTATRSNRIVRYLLAKLETHAGGQEVDIDSATVTIEHLLPQSPGEGWEAFTDEEVEALTYRLGNMALLEKDLNRDGGNADWEAKRPVLRESGFTTTQPLAELPDWTPQRIAGRQRDMARAATALWRVSQLS